MSIKIINVPRIREDLPLAYLQHLEPSERPSDSAMTEFFAAPSTPDNLTYLYSRSFESFAHAAGMMYANERTERQDASTEEGRSDDHYAYNKAFWRGVCDQRATLSMHLHRYVEQPYFRIRALEPFVLLAFVEALLAFDKVVFRRPDHCDPEPWSQKEINSMNLLASKSQQGITLTSDPAQKLVFLLYGDIVEDAERPDGVIALHANVLTARKILAWKSNAQRRGWIKAETGKEFPLSERRRGRKLGAEKFEFPERSESQ